MHTTSPSRPRDVVVTYAYKADPGGFFLKARTNNMVMMIEVRKEIQKARRKARQSLYTP